MDVCVDAVTKRKSAWQNASMGTTAARTASRSILRRRIAWLGASLGLAVAASWNLTEVLYPPPSPTMVWATMRGGKLVVALEPDGESLAGFDETLSSPFVLRFALLPARCLAVLGVDHNELRSRWTDYFSVTEVEGWMQFATDETWHDAWAEAMRRRRELYAALRVPVSPFEIVEPIDLLPRCGTPEIGYPDAHLTQTAPFNNSDRLEWDVDLRPSWRKSDAASNGQ